MAPSTRELAASKDQHSNHNGHDGSQPLMDEGAKPKKEWLAEAEKSECSANIDAFYQATDPTNHTVKELKVQMFDQIYDAMGKEVPASELQEAVVVKTVKYHPIMAGVLKVLTLGLFVLFRPRDDDTALVLTKHGHVLMHKMERPNFLGRNSRAVIVTLMQYIIALAAIFSLPWLLHMVANVDIDEHTLRKLRRNSWIVFGLCMIFAAAFVLWLFSKCPHDYGNRIRQNHAAGAVCAGQFTLTGSARHRKSTLRLFFGKYPPQVMMDLPGTLSLGQVAGPINPKMLTLAGRFGRGNSGLFTALTVMLSVVTVMDTGFGWVDRSFAIAQYVSHHHFCVDSNSIALCTVKRCTDWAENKEHTDSGFCSQVRWYNITNDPKDKTVCLGYGHPSPPCCGGCTQGEALGYLGDAVTAFREVLSVLGDIGTLIFSFMAARSAIGVATATDSIDLSFKKMATDRAIYELKRTSNFELTQPLALHFAEQVFRMAFSAHHTSGAEDVEGGGVAPQAPPPQSQPAGQADNGTEQEEKDMPSVNRFVTSTATHWDEFLTTEKLIIAGPTKWSSTVNVPKRCLGILPNEPVLAAWIEMPHMTLASLAPLLAVSIGVFLIMDFWPTEGGQTGMKLSSALLFATVFFVVSAVIQYLFLFRAIEHVVIVTSKRIFYVRNRQKCITLCIFGSELRVDVFRHDSAVTYGHLHTTMLPISQRAQCAKWFPGNVYLQVRYGVLQLNRNYGNAVDVYHIVSKLTQGETLLHKEDLVANCVDVERCLQEVAQNITHQGNQVWSISRRPDDVSKKDPEIYLASASEQPLFFWSFKEKGLLASPYDRNTDIIITTERVFLWNRTLHKTFDCVTCCCWGTFWCACFSKLFNPERLPAQMSFLTLSALLSFSTETVVQPPAWHDPHHTPLKVPCLEDWCENLTRCFTRDPRGFSCGCCKAGCCPKRSGARTQLWLMWRLKANGQQPDLQVSVRPYALPEADDEEFWDGLDFMNHHQVREVHNIITENVRSTETLRKIMTVAQRASNKL